MSAVFDEHDHPRTPHGQFTTKSGQNTASGVSLAGHAAWSIDDPEFQRMNGPLPHLDGAEIEFDNGEKAIIHVLSSRGSTSTYTHLTDLDGNECPMYIPAPHTYRVTSWDGNPQRLENELEYVNRRQEAMRASREEERRRNDVRNLFDAQDDVFAECMTVVDASGSVRIPYANADGSRHGCLFYTPEDGSIHVRPGSDTTSQRYTRMKNVCETSAFGEAAQTYVDAHKDCVACMKSSREQGDLLEETYGRRY